MEVDSIILVNATRCEDGSKILLWNIFLYKVAGIKNLFVSQLIVFSIKYLFT